MKLIHLCLPVSSFKHHFTFWDVAEPCTLVVGEIDLVEVAKSLAFVCFTVAVGRHQNCLYKLKSPVKNENVGGGLCPRIIENFKLGL